MSHCLCWVTHLSKVSTFHAVSGIRHIQEVTVGSIMFNINQQLPLFPTPKAAFGLCMPYMPFVRLDHLTSGHHDSDDQAIMCKP